jgi:hypothetical protein
MHIKPNYFSALLFLLLAGPLIAQVDPLALDSALVVEKKIKSCSILNGNIPEREFQFYPGGKVAYTKFKSTDVYYHEFYDPGRHISYMVTTLKGDTIEHEWTEYNAVKKPVRKIRKQLGLYELIYGALEEHNRIDSIFYANDRLSKTLTYWGDKLHTETIHQYDAQGNRTDSTTFIVTYFELEYMGEQLIYTTEKYNQQGLLILKRDKVFNYS